MTIFGRGRPAAGAVVRSAVVEGDDERVMTLFSDLAVTMSATARPGVRSHAAVMIA